MTQGTKDNRDAMLQRGLGFMRVRRDLVRDPACLEMMIMACIAEGYVTRDDIVRTVPKYVGHSYAHVAAVLDSYEGSDPLENYWRRDDAKTFHLHR